MPAPGDTYLLRKPGHDTEHLWVVLSAVEESTGQVLAVNLTTRRHNSDPTTVIRPGEHPFITRETVAAYFDARWMSAVALDAAVNQRAGKKLDPCSPELLRRIQDGLLASKFTPKDVQRWWQQHPTPDGTV